MKLNEKRNFCRAIAVPCLDRYLRVSSTFPWQNMNFKVLISRIFETEEDENYNDIWFSDLSKYNSYLYYCLFQLPMRAFCRARLVEREELPRPPAADLPVRGQRLALQRPRAVEENGDRVKVVLTVTLVQHDERRNISVAPNLGRQTSR